MANESNRIISLLDQLLPFLGASPDWLKYWIYIVIFLNLITIAGVTIFYLISQQRIRVESSLERFSVDQPRDGEEIPLSEGRIIEGKFPKVQGSPKEGDGVSVEVRKMPDRRSIYQDGKAMVNTFDGTWSYEVVKFDGYGDYSIVVTASLAGQSKVQRLVVQCRDKTEVFRRLIERDRKLRGAPELVVPPHERVSLDQEYQKLDKLQRQFIDKYLSGNLGEALEIVYRGLDDVLDQGLVLFPDDVTIQNFRAFFIKNYAMILRDRNDLPKFHTALDEAETLFKVIRDRVPNDTNAWNGLGSVALLRGEPEDALYYIDRALSIAPKNEFALHDRKLALDALRKETLKEDQSK
jgi:hypothetical protein